jgi:hypothetical protein
VQQSRLPSLPRPVEVHISSARVAAAESLGNKVQLGTYPGIFNSGSIPHNRRPTTRSNRAISVGILSTHYSKYTQRPIATKGRGRGRQKPNQPAAMATGVDAKLLKSTKFPPEFNQKVDMQKVNVQVMKK